MTGYRSKLTGVAIKDGKITVQPRKPRNASEAIRQKRSKRVKVAKPGAIK